MTRCFHRDEAVLPAEGLPAALLDVGARRGAHPHRLLAGTRLFEEDLLRPGAAVTPAQLARMIDNARRLGLGDDLFFLLGHLDAPTALGPVAALTASAPDVDGVLRALVRHRGLHAPCLLLRRVRARGGAWLLVEDGIGFGSAWPQVRDYTLVLITAVLRRLVGHRPDFRLYLPGPAPSAPEQHQEAFGDQVRFGAPLCALWFDARALGTAVPSASRTRHRIALGACAALRRAAPVRVGWLEAVYRDQLVHDGDLESAAARFGVSPATFKRRLRAHGTRFQAIADRAALHRVLHLAVVRDADVDAVVRTLGFSDPSNFRRAFKRWTGLRPRELLATLGEDLAAS